MIELIAKTEKKIRPWMAHLPPKLYITTYSRFRNTFLRNFVNCIPKSKIEIGQEHKVKLWDIEFNSPLFNAAGMFKLGAGYRKVYMLGAGAFLAGTSTATPRFGNVKENIKGPFVPLPNSKAAINWLGLPNPGHSRLAKVINDIEAKPGCPIGVSLSVEPNSNGSAPLDKLIDGFNSFIKAGASFAELNESCPNVAHNDVNYDSSGLDINLINRAEYLYEKFIKRKDSNFPIILKFSNDTSASLVNKLVDLAIDFHFDGINFGNTSVNYQLYRNLINSAELNSYDYFTSHFGGGLSGSILKDASLHLSSIASRYLTTKSLNNEFHIIRTGGIDSYDDIKKSKENNIYLNQWYTGFFENFAMNGNNVYKEFFNNIDK